MVIFSEDEKYLFILNAHKQACKQTKSFQGLNLNLVTHACIYLCRYSCFKVSMFFNLKSIREIWLFLVPIREVCFNSKFKVTISFNNKHLCLSAWVGTFIFMSFAISGCCCSR